MVYLNPLNEKKMNTQSAIIEKLNVLLATLQTHYNNTRGFYWNIKGKHFFELHEKFGELYEGVAQKSDEIAERILALGGSPLHTAEDFLAVSMIKTVKNTHTMFEAWLS
jgi:starvation-inducible DNA-binding protein